MDNTFTTALQQQGEWTYAEMRNGRVTVKTWVFPISNEMDVETWIDGEYVSTVTVPLIPATE